MAWLAANTAVIATVLAILPFAAGEFWAYALALYFLYAIAGLGVGVSWGQAGLLSLGQGFFVGIGAYLSGMFLIDFSDSGLIVPLLVVSTVVPGALAYGLGRMIFRGRTQNGAFFALITLALVLLASQVATSWTSVTGGYNGLRGIPGIPGMADFEDAYTLSAAALLVSMLLAGWVIASPLGVLWRALAQQERRMAYLGFDHNHLKSVAFGLSGLLGGLAGALYAPENSLVTPDLFGFVLSANLVVWVAIGGRGTLYGPVLGVVALGLLTADLRDTVTYWEAVLAAIFIVTVLRFRRGICGRLEPALKRWFDRRKRALRTAPARRLPQTDGSLAVEGVNLRADSVRILQGLELGIEKPGIYCLIGPNGAGKTSTFDAITGELGVQSGTVRVLGSAGRRHGPRGLALRGSAASSRFRMSSTS